MKNNKQFCPLISNLDTKMLRAGFVSACKKMQSGKNTRFGIKQSLECDTCEVKDKINAGKDFSLPHLTFVALSSFEAKRKPQPKKPQPKKPQPKNFESALNKKFVVKATTGLVIPLKVHAARLLYKAGFRIVDIARTLNMPKSSIQNYIKNTTWKEMK